MAKRTAGKHDITLLNHGLGSSSKVSAFAGTHLQYDVHDRIVGVDRYQ